MKKLVFSCGAPFILSLTLFAEPAAYLGVATRPVDTTLGAHLSLSSGIGLVVTEIDEEGPAIDLLRRDDVLHRLDDQKLVSQQQLRVLIAEKKVGEGVQLFFFRGGKAGEIKAVLSKRPARLESGSTVQVAPAMGLSLGQANVEAKRRMDEVLAELGLQQGQVRSFQSKAPPVGVAGGLQVVPPNGGGLPPQNQHTASSVSKVQIIQNGYSVTVESENGQRTARVADANDTVVFEGPINTEKEREKLPAKAWKVIDGITM